ncbi:MAG: helix-turn-helix transcriptional regulator [Lachnospiraceae bacterium]|nr:helix-turn-helix transcriptional regulator [Lachnospiraceae bacterium]
MDHQLLNYQVIGQKFKSLRQAQGITQEELARRCNISASYLSHIESGNRNLSLETFSALCRELSVSSDFILFDQLPKNDTSGQKLLNLAKEKGDASFEIFLSVMKILAENADQL